MAQNGEEQRDHIEPDEAALLFLVVDDVERVEDRFMPALALHSAMPSPRRKPKVSLPSLLAANAGDLLAQEIERAGRDDVGGNRKMLADRRHVGEQRVGRNTRGDGRKQGHQGIERDAGGERQEHGRPGFR
jgi:hypothetical protein